MSKLTLDPVWLADGVLHVGAGEVHLLRRAGARRLFVQRDPFTSGPLPVCLDRAGVGVRRRYWDFPAVGERALLNRLEDTMTVVLWGYGDAADHLRRAWVRSVVDSADLPIAIHRGHLPRLRPDPHIGTVDPLYDELAVADRRCWAAATGSSPHSHTALSGPLETVRTTLLRWYPRQDTGLCHWEHAILERLEPVRPFVKVMVSVLRDSWPDRIGDRTLVRVTQRLARAGLVEGDDWRKWTVEASAFGNACLEGTPCWSVVRDQVGGVQLRNGTTLWAVDDHLNLVLVAAGA